MNDKIYITTTIPYVNARPHVGFALELVQADCFARYQRLSNRQVRLQTGTDENAIKNVLSAREQGIPTQEFVELNSGYFKALNESLGISADDFIRTTEERHRIGVREFWNRLKPDDLYLKNYQGTYCVGCEDFLAEKDLVNGRCPEHETEPKVVEEQNYFFRLSRYQDELERLLASDQISIRPVSRKNEVLSFIRRGLLDISVSRTIERTGGWGIAVPDNPNQIIYVWIDALINYLTGPGFGSHDHWKEYWEPGCRKVHVIGKNVWKFHAIYWPALLLSAGLPLPDEIIIHGFLTQNGKKISKSLGNAIDPDIYIRKYGADAVRYYLLRAIPPQEDGDFSEARLANLYASDLANGLGNLCSRLTNLAEKCAFEFAASGTRPDAPAGFSEAVESFQFDQALAILWETIEKLNKEIDREKPWQWLKCGELDRLRTWLQVWYEALYRTAVWLSPFLPDTGSEILGILRQRPAQKCRPLFPKTD